MGDGERMNERIKQLAEHARIQYEQGGAKIQEPGQYYHEDVVSKFAELIVEQCAGIIESQDVDPSFKLRMSWAVKQYFGVEQ
jgi:hypothetical protein